MTAKLVPTVRTQYTQYELTKGLVAGWVTLFAVVPKKEQIAVIWAQNALETGMSVAMWCNNIGNIKYVPGPNDTEEIQYCKLTGVWEVVNGKRITLSPDDPGSWFRAFPTLAEGVAFHFNFLKNKRYKIAWSAVEAGDPIDFSHKLKLQGYYTAPEADYSKAVGAYFNKFMKDTSFEKALVEVSNVHIPDNTSNNNGSPVVVGTTEPLVISSPVVPAPALTPVVVMVPVTPLVQVLPVEPTPATTPVVAKSSVLKQIWEAVSGLNVFSIVMDLLAKYKK